MPETEVPMDITKKVMKKPKSAGRLKGFFKFLFLLLILAIVGFLVWSELQRRDITKQLEQTSQELQEVKRSTNQQGEEVAKEVLAKVRTHILIPEDPAPTVATIVDVDSLRKTNAFYEKASNGDHLIITSERAILYNQQKNIIIDVVPVQIQETTPSPTPSLSPSPSSRP